MALNVSGMLRTMRAGRAALSQYLPGRQIPERSSPISTRSGMEAICTWRRPLSGSRDHKDEKVRIADAGTGEVREVFGETVPTQYESGRNAIDWRWLSDSNEIIWYSERDNWGHLYLYDAKTGQLKNQITRG